MPHKFDRVEWHIQIRAESEKEVDKVIKEFGNAAGATMRVLSREGAWRVKDLFDVKMTSPMNCEAPQEAIFRFLLMIRNIASGWQIKGPIDYDDGQWLFGALASQPQARFLVTGVEWANVEIRNFPMVRK